MTNAYKDENGVNTIIGALNTTGTSLVRIKADSSTHRLAKDDNTTGTNHGPTNGLKDENGVTGLMVVSETDGKTPIALYVNSSGQLLIDST